MNMIRDPTVKMPSSSCELIRHRGAKCIEVTGDDIGYCNRHSSTLFCELEEHKSLQATVGLSADCQERVSEGLDVRHRPPRDRSE